MTDIAYTSEDGLPVTLPSGVIFNGALTSDEVTYVQERVQKYMDEFHFQNVSDLQDVDRLVVNELLVYRWQLFVAKGKDYWDEGVAEQALRKSINDFSVELRNIKKQLGMDKASRDKERGEDSVPNYIQSLLTRAKEFGVNREKMMDKGLTLCQQLIALYTLHKNCDEKERLENQCTAEDLLKWIETTFIPEFEAVDEHFRKNVQRYWIAKQ
jgi:hypothetical protein